ncbi:MAG: hypothetical protein PHR00_03935 [Patescibacteria group bacterium]|nr:hypothetical protein [Patescibacteria group bacterium]
MQNSNLYLGDEKDLNSGDEIIFNNIKNGADAVEDYKEDEDSNYGEYEKNGFRIVNDDDDSVIEDETDDYLERQSDINDNDNDFNDSEEETVREIPLSALLKKSAKKIPEEVPANSVAIPAARLVALKNMADRLKADLIELSDAIAALAGEAPSVNFKDGAAVETKDESGKIIEGVFDGGKMIGSDGQTYSVPINYASKSKLVEGDIMKLTINKNGSFVFKQIGPIERKHLIGVLAQDEEDNYWVFVGSKKWRILSASVTYFKGSVGDEATILVPKEGASRWAAVENIVHKNNI